ncbi:MAG: bifunctional 5,10-methylenetetrahydrofolate dehydrogenase/5,10-methenyltetrahydrofolate cyclohydrolase [Candidatus Hodarchaeota archaeon]
MEEYKDKILNGTAASNELRESLKPRIAKLGEKGVVPGLATILVGDDPASKIYVSYKHKGCKALGINSYEKVLPVETTENELMEIVKEYNADEKTHGILVQSPVPKHIDMEKIIACIDPKKDVDGFHPQNLGNLLRGNMDNIFVSCTPAGIIYLLKEWGKIELKGLEVVIVNRSNLVGKPLIPLFLMEHATVTTCHTRTKDLKFHTKRADLLVTGVGRPRYFTADYFKEGVIVVDVGISRIESGVCGDVDFENVVKIASKITPVPGGVGPMTISMLLLNTVTSAERSSS